MRPAEPQKQKWPHFWGHDAKRQKVGNLRIGDARCRSTSQSGRSGSDAEIRRESKVAASLLPLNKALPAPKNKNGVTEITPLSKLLILRSLALRPRFQSPVSPGSTNPEECRCMHIHCILLPGNSFANGVIL